MSGTSTVGFPENLPPEWRRRLAPEKEKPYFKELARFLRAEYAAGKKIYPARTHILRALQLVDFDDVKVVILGQDPYHGPGQAVGLSFAVPNELRPKPPSLVNIFMEIQSDLGVDMKSAGTELSGWARQGVLLLNSVLTVRAGQAFSHQGRGWEVFTDRIIEELDSHREPLVFLLWGAAAQKKKGLLKSGRHKVLESAHPSPLSANRGFLGSRHFSKANALLGSWGRKPIDWSLTV